MRITLPAADLELVNLPNYNQTWFRLLRQETPWTQGHVTLYGKTHPEPRLTAWYGDHPYTYSGIKRDPLPWTMRLIALKSLVEVVADHEFNSCLLNFYRDGRDSIGFHSDDEPELGPEPTIASLSLGGTRTFILRHKARAHSDMKLDLGDGDLLVMRGPTQQHWKHGINKVAHAEPRINLTFRDIRLD